MSATHTQRVNRDFAIDAARAFGGAIIFAVPLLMTMEMWWLGFLMAPWRLALFIALGLPLLFGLSYFAGFEATPTLLDDLRETLAAYAIAFAASASLLLLFGVIAPGQPPHEILGKIAVQTVPAGLGAMLARDQLGQGGSEDEQGRRRHARYPGQLFLMLVGALFLSMSVAPTEEVTLIAHQMSDWHILALILASLLLMHGLVYAVEFSGQEETPPGTPAWSLFFRYTVVGYAVALLISAYILWTFGQADDTALAEFLRATIVLGFPAALGAAAARLLV
jgi:putative integral membrane protein (TIGR02587 family)